MSIWTVGNRVVSRDSACISSRAPAVIWKTEDWQLRLCWQRWQPWMHRGDRLLVRRGVTWLGEYSARSGVGGAQAQVKGKEDEGRHKDWSRIYPWGDVVINRVKWVEEGVAPIDPYSTSISKGVCVSEYDGEGSVTGTTRSCGTPASSCSQTGSAYWDSASFYHCWSW